MKKIIFTGASGLIGSHLIEMLNSLDFKVFSEVRKINNQVNKRQIAIDLNNLDNISNIASLLKFDLVVHLTTIVVGKGIHIKKRNVSCKHFSNKGTC